MSPSRFHSSKAPTGRLLTMLVTTAVLVAVADGLAAVIITYFIHGRPPIVVFQYIASGLLGRSAFSGGWGTALAGALLHVFIASVWTVIIYMIDHQLARHNIGKTGRVVLYGLVIWTGMNLVVVPLSNVPSGQPGLQQVVIGITAVILAAALPMVYRFDSFNTGN